MTVYDDMLNRLFAKYQNSPNILGVLEILASAQQDTSDVLDWIIDRLSIDDGDGEILDSIGEIIGVSRFALQEERVFQLVRSEEISDDPYHLNGTSSDGESDGGYLSGPAGCVSKEFPDAEVTDADHRELIRSKAATYRKKATRANLYTSLLALGHRCRIHESGKVVEIEPSVYNDLNYLLRNYIVQKGFRPAGIKVRIKHQTSPDSEV
jgi:hypothetical protein